MMMTVVAMTAFVIIISWRLRDINSEMGQKEGNKMESRMQKQGENNKNESEDIEEDETRTLLHRGE